MAPREAQGAWLHCGRGGNTLPLPMRLQAAGQTPTGVQLAGTLGCLRQLGGEILQLHAAHAPALSGLPSLCAKGTAAMGAESAGLITAHQMGVESCLFEAGFDAAAAATMAAAPACARALACLRYEMRQPDPNPNPNPDPNPDPNPHPNHNPNPKPNPNH